MITSIRQHSGLCRGERAITVSVVPLLRSTLFFRRCLLHCCSAGSRQAFPFGEAATGALLHSQSSTASSVACRLKTCAGTQESRCMSETLRRIRTRLSLQDVFQGVRRAIAECFRRFPHSRESIRTPHNTLFRYLHRIAVERERLAALKNKLVSWRAAARLRRSHGPGFNERPGNTSGMEDRRHTRHLQVLSK